MSDIFGFFNMLDNYEDRKIAKFEEKELVISTCSVTDNEAGFETAVGHPLYNRGEWVIVEEYYNPEAAQKGHDKWVKIMTRDNLPTELKDVSTCMAAKLMKAHEN